MAVTQAGGSGAAPVGQPEGVVHRGMSRRRGVIPYYLMGPAGIYLLIFLILPLFLLVYTSLQSGGLLSGGFTFTWQFSNYVDNVTQYWNQYLRSVQYAAIATVACLLLAYPMMYWIAFYGGRRKASYLLLILLPFFVTFVIRAVMWKFILADDGILLGPLKSIGLLPESYHVLSTRTAVILGLTYNYLVFTALPIYVALERIDKRLVEAAKDLYASRWEAFIKVVWPLSLPGVFAAFLLTFVPATGDYVEASVLGGPANTMIGNIIQTKYLFSNAYPDAAALSVVLMIAMVILVSIYARVLGTEDVTTAATA